MADEIAISSTMDSSTDLRNERKLGVFEDELSTMLERQKKVMPFPKDEVILLGMGATRRRCPFDAEVWSVNTGYCQVCQLDGHVEKIFMTHTQVWDGMGRPYFNWPHYNKMIEAGIEVWNIHKVKGLNAKLFPLQRLIKKYDCAFFTDTIAYMLAWAIDKGYKKIRLYGCDMMTREEYAWEKGGIEYWIGYARAKGITVEISDGSTLCKTISGKPYGIKYWTMKQVDPTGELRRKGQRIMGVEPGAPTPWVRL